MAMLGGVRRKHWLLASLSLTGLLILLVLASKPLPPVPHSPAPYSGKFVFFVIIFLFYLITIYRKNWTFFIVRIFQDELLTPRISYLFILLEKHQLNVSGANGLWMHNTNQVNLSELNIWDRSNFNPLFQS